MINSRHADNLIWMSRFIERAENNARILDVNIIRPFAGEGVLWEPLVAVAGNVEDFYRHYSVADAATVFQYFTFSQMNLNSIYMCLRQARENASAVRERLPREFYEEINSFCLVVRACINKVNEKSAYAFLNLIKRRSFMLQGMIEAIMSHGEDGAFLRLGRYLERADKTARLLDVVYLQPRSDQEDFWLQVLESVSAYEAYRSIWGGQITQREVTSYLIQQAEFPRSLIFCVRQALAAARCALPNRKGVPEPICLMERLEMRLRHITVEEMENRGIHQFLLDFIVENNGVGNEINRFLFAEEEAL
ncbi:hypothetical protein GJ688_06305 [Heliobacillus mobilis]|uniref:DUF403 domain-containing protein n=1 Tax=Heliobacterium mobile TaxID=28064 RepID=A0A6I3SI95_HELMO|nr:alpha-E domain-containing protein [Heliobacterium mobile]MTV48594.1 hypothetical protein [Heliobacterium mobile]